VSIVLKSESLNLLEPSGPVQACNGIALSLLNSTAVDISDCSILLHVPLKAPCELSGQFPSHVVARLVVTLRYKPEGRGFYSRWNYFFIDIILPAALWPCVDSASNRNKYQEYYVVDKAGRSLRQTTLSPSCADCLDF